MITQAILLIGLGMVVGVLMLALISQGYMRSQLSHRRMQRTLVRRWQLDTLNGVRDAEEDG